MQKMRIFVTGGHVTPALAVIEEIKKRETEWEIFFVGRKYSMEGDKEVSSEYQTVTALSIPFLPLSAGRLNRRISLKSLVSLIKIMLSFIQSLGYIFFYRPQLVISFGGYVAVPVALAAWICHVPIVTHEQTQKSGLGNRFIGLFARRVYVSYKESLDHFDINKALWVGLPIRSQLFSPPDRPSFICDQKRPILYVTGGATGAQSMNRLIFPIIERLCGYYTVIHQTGSTSYKEALEWQSKLEKTEKEHYLPFAYTPISDLAWIYKKSALVVSRSGANTVGELAALGKIAVLIPLPWSANNEQQENAMFLARAGSAIIIDQTKIDPEQLFAAIDKILKEKQKFQKNAVNLQKTYPTDGAVRMVDDLLIMTAQ